MTDNRTKSQRSYNMSRIRSVNTTPELLVRKFLYTKGIHYRINVRNLTGKPDIVIRKLHSVIFIQGCFWHGHKNCKYAKVPEANNEFWINKITTNAIRDNKNQRILEKDGWKVIIIWECDLNRKKVEKTLNNLLHKLKD